jgi:hypothetical protein
MKELGGKKSARVHRKSEGTGVVEREVRADPAKARKIFATKMLDRPGDSRVISPPAWSF